MKNSILFVLLVVFGSISIISCGEPSTPPIKTERSFEVICDSTVTELGYYEDPETGERIAVEYYPCDTIYVD
jgi:hypothetical protein